VTAINILNKVLVSIEDFDCEYNNIYEWLVIFLRIMYNKITIHIQAINPIIMLLSPSDLYPIQYYLIQ